MQAMVFSQYGSPDLLRLQEVKRPQPAGDQVLVRIHAASLNYGDVHFVRGDPFPIRFIAGFPKPSKIRILGWDMAGIVEAVGANVRQLHPGDAVMGELSGSGCGAFAEYACAPEKVLVKKPADASFEQAAAVPVAALTALQGLRDQAGVKPGDKVLINGASGGVGSFAIQIAKALGAEVTAVCSTRNLEAAREMGADHVVDYKAEDFTRNGRKYDIIFAANGYHPMRDYLRALTPNGTYVMAGGTMTQIAETFLLGPLLTARSSKKVRHFVAECKPEDLSCLAELLERGKLRPVIDATYPLSELPAALHYMEDEHPRGKVVIRMAA